VPLPLDELGWLKIPKPGTEEKGSRATVRMKISGKPYEWDGQIIRSLGEVDSRSRMMQVIVSVQDPYRLQGKGDGDILLNGGTFVEVSIKGKEIRGVFSIPRTAVRDNSTVWIMDDEDMLRVRSVKIIRKGQAEVIVSAGLAEGERIVITSLAGASDGMKLRSAEEETTK
jgi:multidrug efflux pump subunit AcrA (membrane-fusion protein)